MGYLMDIKSTELHLQGVSNISNFSFEPRSVHHYYTSCSSVFMVTGHCLLIMGSTSLNNDLVVVCYLIVSALLWIESICLH